MSSLSVPVAFLRGILSLYPLLLDCDLCYSGVQHANFDAVVGSFIAFCRFE